MLMVINGVGVRLTPVFREFAEQKLRAALRAFGAMNRESLEVRLQIERTTRRHRKGDKLYRAEATLAVPGGTLRAEGLAPSPDAAVEGLRETLAREIRTWRERKISANRKGARAMKRRLKGG